MWAANVKNSNVSKMIQANSLLLNFQMKSPCYLVTLSLERSDFQTFLKQYVILVPFGAFIQHRHPFGAIELRILVPGKLLHSSYHTSSDQECPPPPHPLLGAFSCTEAENSLTELDLVVEKCEATTMHSSHCDD